MENIQDNPFLQPEDFFKGYNESIEKLKNDPNLVFFDKLCFELFYATETGKKFIEFVTENYLIPPLADRNSPNFKVSAVWAEGFKDFGRMLRSSVKSHEQRIKAEENNNVG